MSKGTRRACMDAGGVALVPWWWCGCRVEGIRCTSRVSAAQCAKPPTRSLRMDTHTRTRTPLSSTRHTHPPVSPTTTSTTHSAPFVANFLPSLSRARDAMGNDGKAAALAQPLLLGSGGGGATATPPPEEESSSPKPDLATSIWPALLPGTLFCFTLFGLQPVIGQLIQQVTSKMDDTSSISSNPTPPTRPPSPLARMRPYGCHGLQQRRGLRRRRPHRQVSLHPGICRGHLDGGHAGRRL